ncbi:hypothetical protein DFH06DRAFT_1213993 [Mycena polygramma]|nr:hypothetical protein DFH06DRAFT_1213993 [Mycena polygramma]
MAHIKVYTEQLCSKWLGYPLWHPQPIDSLPQEYRTQGVRIGDVGCINDRGAFSFIFNICLAADNPINVFGVPPGFQKVELDPVRSIERVDVAFEPGTDVATETIKTRHISLGVEVDGPLPVTGGGSIELSCSSTQGAALLLPHGASSSDLLPLEVFRKYVLQHAKSWFAFVANLGRPVDGLNLYLVTGCDKASSWGVATFSRSSNAGEVSMKFGPSGIAHGHAQYSWDKSLYTYGFAQAGPRYLAGGQLSGENQCVFVRGYSVAMRNIFISAVKGPLQVEPVAGSSKAVYDSIAGGSGGRWGRPGGGSSQSKLRGVIRWKHWSVRLRSDYRV